MIKIGIDVRELEKGKLTGIGRFLIEFLRYVSSRQLIADYQMEFVLFGNQNTDFSNNVLKDYEKIVVKEGITLFWDQIKLKNALKKNDIALFFSPYYKVPLFSKIPSIISLFDLIYFTTEPYKNQLKNKFYIKNFIKLAGKKAKKILTISHSAKNDLIQLLNLPKDKIEVVYLSISENFYRRDLQETESVKKKYNIDKKYILYVGNSNPHKNLSRLVEAFNLLPDDVKNKYSLVIAGVGGFVSNHLPSTVYRLPFVSDEDLPALYSGADLFVFPSLYEGFGLPPLEAMACGCPVVSSNTSSMPEILGDTCLYFNPYNIEEIGLKIIELIDNNTLKKEYINKGMERVKMFSAAKMTEKLIEIFKNYG